jgi:hypothetical protein
MTALPVIYDPYRGTRLAARSPEVEIAVKPTRARPFVLGLEPLGDLRPDERWSWSDGIEDPAVTAPLSLPDPCQEALGARPSRRALRAPAGNSSARLLGRLATDWRTIGGRGRRLASL